MGWIFAYRFRRSTVILLLCLSFLVGVGVAHVGQLFSWFWAGLVLLVLLPVLRRQNIVALVLVVLFGVCLGWWRGSLYMEKLAAYDQVLDQKVTITARAMEDATYGKTKQLAFAANDIVLDNGERLDGKVQLSGFGANAVFDGDVVVATGKLRRGFSAYQGRMSFAQITVFEHRPSIVAEVRRRFAAGMRTALPEPLASFSMGILVGQRATLSEQVKEDFLMVGLTHIIAVSGYNLTIILHASKKLLGKQSKRLSTFLSVGLIFVFLMLAGASASIVRAAIVSMLSIVTDYYGRNFRPLTLISFAAAITAWANPFYLWSDLSWYLSFLAFYGVMVLSPLVQKRWPARWHKTLIGGVALESICAEVMSLPFVLHIFGQMSFIGLPANMLVVALIPLAMLLGLIAGLAGMFISAVSGWFAWPAALLLNYMLDIAHLMAHLPHIFVENKSMSLAVTLSLYLLIILFCVSLRRKTKDIKPDIITDIEEPKLRGFSA
ncbi:MAG: ComEC/Rec2 family competence protein [Patescibacteria group bacterium]